MLTTTDDLLEAYPADLEDWLELAQDRRKLFATGDSALEFLVADMASWAAGGTVTVAFLDGDDDLHAAVADTARTINDVCGIELDFGFDAGAGTYRGWTEDDTAYQADIRVSFDQSGYWSLVGTASIDRGIAPEPSPVGGHPHQRSLNLGGFDRSLPAGWRRTVLHEFLHALAFKHEHQIRRRPCQDAYRWDDDPGYVPTKNGAGRFVADSHDRRPGIYTYLGGEPNNWDRQRVDRNLRDDSLGPAAAGEFDPESVMRYRFAPLFYRTWPSPCAPETEGDELSAGDIRGLQLLYPVVSDPRIQGRAEQARMARAALLTTRRNAESLDTPEIGLLPILDRLSYPT